MDQWKIVWAAGKLWYFLDRVGKSEQESKENSNTSVIIHLFVHHKRVILRVCMYESRWTLRPPLSPVQGVLESIPVVRGGNTPLLPPKLVLAPLWPPSKVPPWGPSGSRHHKNPLTSPPLFSNCPPLSPALQIQTQNPPFQDHLGPDCNCSVQHFFYFLSVVVLLILLVLECLKGADKYLLLFIWISPNVAWIKYPSKTEGFSVGRE